MELGKEGNKFWRFYFWLLNCVEQYKEIVCMRNVLDIVMCGVSFRLLDGTLCSHNLS